MGPLVPCSGYVDASGKFVDACTYADLFILIQNIINFAVYLAVPIGTIAIVAAGIMYVMSAGNEKYRSMAKTVLTTAAIGLLLTLAAFLIIQTIVNTLGNPGVIKL
jgi:hypothetical protein